MKISSLPYRTQFWLLLAALVMMTIISFQIAIKKTISLHRETNSLEDQLEIVSHSGAEVKRLQAKLFEIERMISIDNPADGSHQLLLNLTSTYCSNNNLILVEFPPSKMVIKDTYKLSLMNLKVKGKYKDLLGLLYYLERQHTLGSISSVEFYSQLNVRTKVQTLYMQVTLKSISYVT